ncbi:hypothetical protein EAS64_34370 [Trebonia kvetii]|uniref:Uncharacterized protein n=1 Tax=Trebonia kvetii TaxID=2480626 RepID=A0A6P2BTE0_9ACTN|nr:hypothetical protein [Trebonia kvetii]TVZ01355.1 hypothetical protein EAS64_34370 [Trebonia kvetii]
MRNAFVCRALDLAADSGLRISAFTAEPGTPAGDGLKFLASWATTTRPVKARAAQRKGFSQ